MKKYIYIAVLPLLALFACNKVNDVNPEDQNTVVSFTAVTNADDTKTTIVESASAPYSYSMSWTGGEVVSVAPFPTTWSGATFSTTPRYTFTNALAAGKSAVFKSTDFTPGTFTNGERYLAIFPKNTGSVGIHLDGAGAIEHGSVRVRIPDNQVYNPANNLGLQDNILPMIGLIQKGGGAGLEPSAVSMKGICSIVKLVVTNNSGSTKTISKITMENSNTSATRGIAGNFYCIFFIPSLQVYAGSCYWVNSEKRLITLDCGGATIPAGQSKTFSFVTGGNIERSFIGDLSWSVYDGSETVIATASNTATGGTNRLFAEKVHTKAITLN